MVQTTNRGIDAFSLKVIAIIGMTSDHIGMVFGDRMPLAAKTLLFAPGGLTFPIMAYLLVEGYRKTSNVHRYMKRLLIFALISLPFFMWAFEMPALNVLVTLLLGLVTLYLNDHMKNRRLFPLALLGITLFTAVCDWGFIGVPIIYLMHVIPDEKRRIWVPIGGTVLLMELALLGQALFGQPDYPQMAFFAGSVVALFLLLNYNGKRGRDMRYFFYAYYPAHLLVLALIRLLLPAAGG